MKDKKSKYTSRTKGDLISVVIIEFNAMADLWFHKSHYDEIGKFKGVLKEMCLSISDVKKVHHLFKNPQDFPTQEWEG